MTTRPRAAAILLTLSAGLLLAGCGPTEPGPASSTKPTATASPSATPTPTPTAEPAPSALACESIVTAATIGGFTSEGTLITPPAEFDAKLTAEGNALAVFFDAGGVVCQTGAGAGAFEIFAYAPLTEAQFAPVQAQFLAEGYSEQVTDAGLLYRVPDGQEGLPRVCYNRPNAFTVCGNDDDRVAEIIEVLGLG